MAPLTLRSAFIPMIFLASISLNEKCTQHHFTQSSTIEVKDSDSNVIDEQNNTLYLAKGSVYSITIETTDQNNGWSRKLYEKAVFDSAGRLVEVIGYRGDGVEMPPTRYLYDGPKLVRKHHYKIDGSLWTETVYSYAASGEITSKVQNDVADGSLLSKKVNITAPQSRTVQVLEYNPAGDLRTDVLYSKDSNGRISEMDVKKGQLIGKRLFKYNGKGEVYQISVLSSDSDTPLIINYRYDYDTHGNWIRRVESSKNENNAGAESISEIIYRTISYY